MLLGLAVLMPVESVDTGRSGIQPMRSWVAVNGYEVMAWVAIPLVVTLIVGLLLTGTRRHHRLALVAARVLAAALLVAALLGTVTLFLICIYVLPAAGLLLAACGVSHPDRRFEQAQRIE